MRARDTIAILESASKILIVINAVLPVVRPRQTDCELDKLAAMKLFSPTRLVSKSAVITLALWLAGAGCLLGCEGIASASPRQHHDSSSKLAQTATLVVGGDACASTEGHGCCKKKTRAVKNQPATALAAEVHSRTEADLTSRELDESAPSGVKGCPFAISRALSVAKLRDGQMSATNGPSPALPAQVVAEQKLALSAVAPLPNRGHTYLHCCSFLI